MKNNPDGTAKELLEFLELDYFVSASVRHEVHPTYEPTSKILQYVARKISTLLRKLNLYKVVDFVKFTVGKSLIYGSNPSSPSLNEVEMEKLFDFVDEFGHFAKKTKRATQA